LQTFEFTHVVIIPIVMVGWSVKLSSLLCFGSLGLGRFSGFFVFSL
jgi:hypothetical protein